MLKEILGKSTGYVTLNPFYFQHRNTKQHKARALNDSLEVHQQFQHPGTVRVQHAHNRVSRSQQ